MSSKKSSRTGRTLKDDDDTIEIDVTISKIVFCTSCAAGYIS